MTRSSLGRAGCVFSSLVGLPLAGLAWLLLLAAN